MAQYANLVLTDRASTPVNHTFVPSGFLNNQAVATFKKSSGVPVGDKRFSLAVRKTANRRRPSMRLVVPVVATETINGIDSPKVVRTAYANVDFNFDVNSTEQERKDVVGMIATALAAATTLVDDSIVGLNPVF